MLFLAVLVGVVTGLVAGGSLRNLLSAQLRFGALILGRDAGAAITPLDRLLFVTGAALASLSWQTLLAGLGSLANQRLSPRFQRLTSITGNLIVIALGLRIIVKLVR